MNSNARDIVGKVNVHVIDWIRKTTDQISGKRYIDLLYIEYDFTSQLHGTS